MSLDSDLIFETLYFGRKRRGYSTKPSDRMPDGWEMLYGGFVKGVNDDTFHTAKEMKANKFSPEAIWEKTMWYFNERDKKWRNEILDDDYRFKLTIDQINFDYLIPKKRIFLSDLIEHRLLFKMMPEAKKIIVIFKEYKGDDNFGEYEYGKKITLYINYKYYKKHGKEFITQHSGFGKEETLLAEIQHYLQGRFRYAKDIGYQKARERTQKEIEGERIRLRESLGKNDPSATKLIEEDIKDLEDDFESQVMFEYISQLGEIEARDVIYRMNFDIEERKMDFPLSIALDEHSIDLKDTKVFLAGGGKAGDSNKPIAPVIDADVEGRGGLIVGDSHADGGVPFVLEDSGTHIEEEGEEANLPNEIKDITKVYTFKGKNHEVIHKILQLVGLKLSNKVTSVRSGDLVICKASLWDDTVRTYTGTPIQIVSAVNESEGCNHIESGATMIENGKKVEMEKGGDIGYDDTIRMLYGFGNPVMATGGTIEHRDKMKLLYGDKFSDDETTPCGMGDSIEMDMKQFGGGGKIQKPVAEVIDDIEYYLRKKYTDQAEKIISLPVYSDIVTKKYHAREELIDWMLNPDNNVIVIIAFSGGKDSVAMVLKALDMGVKRENIELWHHDVDGNSEDLFDWKCTKSYCEAFAKAFGVKILFSYKEGGIKREIYKNNEETQPIYYQEEMGGKYKVAYPDPIKNTRMRFPAVAGDLQTRWCSYEVKINVMQKAINGMDRFKRANMLIMTGERRQESKKRGTYLEILPYRSYGKARRAIQWRPIIDWSEKEVWAIYEKHKVQPHPCYELGWGRCSCQLCIFSSPNTWATINEVSPDKVNRIREIEVDIKHTLYHEEEKVQVGVKKDGKPKYKKTGKMYDGVYETKVNKGKSFLLLEKRSRWLKEALGEFVSPIIVDKWELPIGAFNGEDAGAN
jgi:3'-phosphoadenosine 5'-phosphosulfate sulfotransferase (PAPS reductase)/FAD synthetase